MTEKRLTQRFLYIHGFNSSPASEKAIVFSRWCRKNRPGAEVYVPELPFDPLAAMRTLETVFTEGPVALMLGSSLGGYYATWLSEKYNAPAVLINPAVRPWEYMENSVPSLQTNYHTGQQYELTADHVRSLTTYEVSAISRPERLLVLLQTGDEVLDYRRAEEKYRACRQVREAGGSHGFEGFDLKLPEIMTWGEQIASQTNQTEN